MPRAIDVHIHPPSERAGSAAVEEMARKYEELDIFGVLLAMNTESARGEPAMRNEYIADIVRRYPKQFAGFGAIDPWQGKMAIRELQKIKELGLLGVKLMPIMQEFFMNDARFYPIWQRCAELGLVALVHSGTTAVGQGQPGGGGLKLKYSRPIPYIDDVAADFPELTIIMAHPSWPWQEEQLAMLVHKPNVYMDISGWSPKYFQPSLIQYANTLVRDKVMFGSDYPVIMPERWLADFAAAPFRDEVRPKILYENAQRVLKLDV